MEQICRGIVRGRFWQRKSAMCSSSSSCKSIEEVGIWIDQLTVDTSRGCSWESNQASRKTEPMLLQSVTDDPSTTLRFIVDVVQMSNHTGGIGSGQISRDRSHELLSCNAFSMTIRRSPCAFAPKMDRLVTAHPTTPKGADLQSPWWMMEDG